jgi:hypothetical protein
VIVAVALAVLLEFDVDVALIVHVSFVAGAVNRPALVIEPHVADHLTDWFAVNCALPIACSETLVGVTVNAPVAATEPVNVTLWGLFDAESVKLRIAVRVPVAVGLKTTDAAQLACKSHTQ